MFASFLGHTQTQESYWNSAGKKFDSKDYQGALIDYQKAHNIKKDAALAHNIGHCLKNLEDYKGAIYSFSEAIQLKPEYIDAYDGRAEVKFTTEDFYGAISDKYRAIELDEDNMENARRYYFVAFMKINLKDINGGIGDLEKALQIVPHKETQYMAELHMIIGRGYAELENISEAKNNFLKSIEIFPNTEAYKNLIYYIEDDNDKIKYYSEAIKLDPNDAELYKDRGFAYSGIKNYYAAISDFMRYNDLQTEENNLVRGYWWIAFNKAFIGDHKGATDDYSKALQIMLENRENWTLANFVNNYIWRGESKRDSEDNVGALDDYSKALEIAMKNEYEEKHEQISKIYQHRISLKQWEIKDGVVEEASKYLESALALNDNDQISQAYNYRGEGYWLINDFHSAIEVEEDENYYTNRGESLGEIGKYAEAMVDINKALEINPEYGWAYEERGIIKKYLNDLEGACADWEISKKLGWEYVIELIEKNCN